MLSKIITKFLQDLNNIFFQHQSDIIMFIVAGIICTATALHNPVSVKVGPLHKNICKI